MVLELFLALFWGDRGRWALFQPSSSNQPSPLLDCDMTRTFSTQIFSAEIFELNLVKIRIGKCSNLGRRGHKKLDISIFCNPFLSKHFLYVLGALS